MPMACGIFLSKRSNGPTHRTFSSGNHFLSMFGRSAEQDEMRGTIQEGNGDEPMFKEHKGERGTFIEKPANFLAGIRSSVRNHPPRGSKKGKRDANRLSQWRDRPQGDEVISATMLRMVGKVLGAFVEDG